MRSGEGLRALLQDAGRPALRRQLALVWQFSIPAILAQITSVAMQYIDAAMVGSLGASASAAIGVVSTSTWLLYGLGGSLASGYSVQVAQAAGAGEDARARQVVRESLLMVALLSALLGAAAFAAGFRLPRLLGADGSLHHDATAYFSIFALSQPAVMLSSLGIGLLGCSGNMRLSSTFSALTCALDVAFNALFIFPARTVTPGGICLPVPGLGMGVAGAALGTAAAELTVCVLVWHAVLFRSPVLGLRADGRWRVTRRHLAAAARISVPMAFEQVALCGAQIMGTRIIAPLGTVAIAANTFGVTAEALCYMPGYGMAQAATTLVGQSVGAGRRDAARSFAWLTVLCGMAVMALTGLLMYAAAPAVFAFFTPDRAVRGLGVRVLRIEVLAEPLFAAYIISSGALRGAGDTLLPGVMNLCSIWGVRLTLTYALTRTRGLAGAWIAMCVELCLRGLLYLARLAAQKWRKIC